LIGYKGKEILLVEDDAITAMAEKKQLTDYGYTVKHLNSGEESIKEICSNQNKYDLVLMDIDLGDGIDGTDTSKKILECIDIPIVFLSNHTEPEVVEKTEEITSYGYVVKTSGFTVINAMIKMAFKLFDAKKEISERDKLQKQIISYSRDTLYKYNFKTETYDYLSPSIFYLVGYTPDECINMGIDGLMKHLHPDDKTKIQNYYQSLITSQNRKFFNLVYRQRHKNGEYRLISDYNTVFYSDGQPDYTIGSLRAIHGELD
jgi:CheY-like chemotaxis protein